MNKAEVVTKMKVVKHFECDQSECEFIFSLLPPPFSSRVKSAFFRDPHPILNFSVPQNQSNPTSQFHSKFESDQRLDLNISEN